MSNRLENLVATGDLEQVPASPEELRGLYESGVGRLNDARRTDLSVEGRFDLAYNAVHALALYSLRRLGYRARKRYSVFQLLDLTCALPAAQVRVLAKAHAERNLLEYQGHRVHDIRLVDELVRIADNIIARLQELPRT